MSRYTLKEVLSHPWMMGTCKVSSPIPYRERKHAISHESAASFCKELQNLNKCNCPCHNSDCSVLDKHCDDCREVQANNPEVMLKRNLYLSRNSSISSGYGSDMESHLWENLTPINVSYLNQLGLESSLSFEGLCSFPRKSSASTIGSKATIMSNTSQHRYSFPLKTCLKLDGCGENEKEVDEDIIFV